MLPSSLRDCLADDYGIRAEDAAPITGLGDEATIWRVATASHPLIVRVSPRSRDTEQLAESFRLALALAARVPEVTAPVRTVDGAVLGSWDGRPISVWPYVEGTALDRSDPAQRDQAAQLLARLHRAGLELLREGAERVPTASGLVHGVFYSRNLLCRDGRIVGLIDWDDVRIERLDAELAWATWELAKSPTGDELINEHAIVLLDAYRRAGGPARPGADFIQLIRTRLTGELGDDDPDYVASLRNALRTLDQARHPNLVRPPS